MKPKAKKYYRVIIVNDNNEWVATEANCTLKKAVKNYKEDEGKGEYTYDPDEEYHAWGVDSYEDRQDFGYEEDEDEE